MKIDLNCEQILNVIIIFTNYLQLSWTRLPTPRQVPGSATEPSSIRCLHTLDHEVPSSYKLEKIRKCSAEL